MNLDDKIDSIKVEIYFILSFVFFCSEQAAASIEKNSEQNINRTLQKMCASCAVGVSFLLFETCSRLIFER